MPRAPHLCSHADCYEIATRGARCEDHRIDRPTAAARGYDHNHRRFAAAVLARDPICTWPNGCDQPSTDADHHPVSRRQLVEEGQDPNNPIFGRGLCHSHHSQHTRTEADWKVG